MPKVIERLAAHHSESFRHNELGLRQPYGSYNISIYPLLYSFNDVFEEIYKINLKRPFEADSREVWDIDLLDKQLALLRALEEHFELCRSILEGFLPLRSHRGKNPVLTSYDAAVRHVQLRVRKVVNLVKHKQGTLAGFHFLDGPRVHLGYFAQCVASDGYLGPAHHIHKGGNTAFSLNRDLRLNFLAVYYTSSCLASAIKSAVGEPSGPPRIKGDVIDLPRAVASSIAALATIVFPDEVGQPFPSVDVTTPQGGPTSLIIRYPDPLHSLSPPPNPARTVSFHYTDGVTFKWRFPYRKPTDLTKGAT